MDSIIGGVITTPLSPKIIKRKVFDQVSNALKGKKSGESVSISDVSPLEHNISVTVKNSEKLIVSGKNLWDGTGIINGYINDKVYSGDTFRTCYIKCLPNTTYTVSKMLSSRFSVGYTYELPDNEVTVRGTLSNDGATQLTVTTDSNARYLVIYCYHMTNDTVTFDEVLNSLQIEMGDTATEYEPYVEPITYPVNSDGTVDGVKSIYPTTVLFTNSEGATIEAEYNKDINKTLGDLETLLGGI